MKVGNFEYWICLVRFWTKTDILHERCTRYKSRELDKKPSKGAFKSKENRGSVIVIFLTSIMFTFTDQAVRWIMFHVMDSCRRPIIVQVVLRSGFLNSRWLVPPTVKMPRAMCNTTAVGRHVGATRTLLLVPDSQMNKPPTVKHLWNLSVLYVPRKLDDKTTSVKYLWTLCVKTIQSLFSHVTSYRAIKPLKRKTEEIIKNISDSLFCRRWLLFCSYYVVTSAVHI